MRNVAECEMIVWKFSFENSKKWEFGGGVHVCNHTLIESLNMSYVFVISIRFYFSKKSSGHNHGVIY